MNPNPIPRMSPEEFLEFERSSDERHEYRNGEIFAMSGAKRAHNLISVNLAAELRTGLKGRDCETYASDMRIWVGIAALYTYPDMVVVCGELQFLDTTQDTLVNPTVLIEILSESTEAYDRGRKFEYYRKIDSLKEYILIAQTHPYIEKYVKHGDGFWLLSEIAGIDSFLKIESIDCTIPLAEIYDKIDFGGGSGD